MVLLALGREDAPSSVRMLLTSGVGMLYETTEVFVSYIYATPSTTKQKRSSAANRKKIFLNTFIRSIRIQQKIKVESPYSRCNHLARKQKPLHTYDMEGYKITSTDLIFLKE